jgi:hypothetical protein
MASVADGQTGSAGLQQDDDPLVQARKCVEHLHKLEAERKRLAGEDDPLIAARHAIEHLRWLQGERKRLGRRLWIRRAIGL